MMVSNVLFGKNSAVVRCFNFAALGLFMVCLLYSACIPDNIDLPYRINSVTTKGATKITASGATLAGTVSTIDSEKITCGVIYGATSSLSANSGTKKSATLSGNFSINISGLKANTTYYYRAYAVDADVYKYGEVRSFKTSLPNISVTTGSAANITDSSVMLYGTVNGADESVVCGIIYGTSSNISSSNDSMKSTSSTGSYSISLSGLNANTTYYYRAYVLVNGSYKFGEVKSFKTKASSNISAITGDATNITYSSATLSGTINGANQSLTCGIIYGTSSSLLSTSGTKKSTTSNGDFSLSVTSLYANTTYYYCAYVVVDGEYKYGDVRSFKTMQESLSISVTTGSATGITSSGATLSGSIDGADQSLTCGIIYGTSSSLSSSNGTKKSTTSKGSYSFSVTGLNANTTYYYRAYAIVDGEYVYGDVRSFTTKQNVSVTTGSATDVTSSGATLSGSIGGVSQSLTCGIIYGTSSSLSSSSGTKKSTTSSGSYSVSVTNLSDNTTYYYRAYAVVNGEYVYGDVRSFTTKEENKYSAVDLGLSVKWATCNVGASSPEEYGCYYAWGETEEKSNYTKSTYEHYTYNRYPDIGTEISGTVHDVAHVKWGNGWRMPTKSEIDELRYCTWNWTYVNGVYGAQITGSNGNSIFLPSAGFYDEDGLWLTESEGCYWSSTFESSNYAFCMISYRGSRDLRASKPAYYGFTIRPVKE